MSEWRQVVVAVLVAAGALCAAETTTGMIGSGQEPALVGTITGTVALAADAPAWCIQLVDDAAELAYPGVDGTITMHAVADGARRRAVRPGKEGAPPPRFLLDAHQRRVALIEDRSLRLVSFPKLEKLGELELPRDRVIDPATTVFCGTGLLVTPASKSVQILERRRPTVVKLPGEVRAAWGHASEPRVLLWCAAEPTAPANTRPWMLMALALENDGAAWKVEERARTTLPSDVQPVAWWSGDGLVTALADGATLHGWSTTTGESIATATMPADGGEIEGLTPLGRHVLVVDAKGRRTAHTLDAGFEVAATFALPLPDGVQARYLPTSDRWVAVASDRLTFWIVGPPRAAAPTQDGK